MEDSARNRYEGLNAFREGFMHASIIRDVNEVKGRNKLNCIGNVCRGPRGLMVAKRRKHNVT